MLQVVERNVEGVVVLDLAGRITLGEGARRLRELIRSLLNAGERRILLNLAQVDYIDSSGLGELVSSYTLVRQQGGELKLLSLTRKVHDLLQVTKLLTVFDVREDETDALASFPSE